MFGNQVCNTAIVLHKVLHVTHELRSLNAALNEAYMCIAKQIIAQVWSRRISS